MKKRRVAIAKTETGANPLWVIAVAMAIFFVATAAIMALS